MSPAPRVVAPLFACAALAAAAPATPPSFIEREGVVAFEAEHFTERVGPWEEVEGRSALARTAGVSPEYRLSVVHPGSPLAAGAVGEIALDRVHLVSWVMPAAGARIVVATGHDPRKALVFAHPSGAALASGGTAPAARLFTPMPSAQIAETGRWLRAAVEAATDGSKSPSVLLLTNQEDLTRAEEHLRGVLAEAGLTVSLQAAGSATADTARAHDVLVVPISVRSEKLAGKYRELNRPIVIAGKHELATELGLAVAAQPMPTGANAMLIREGAWTDHLRYDVHFEHAGRYHVWLLGQNSGSPRADEVRVFFNQAPDPTANTFLTVTLGEQPGWHAPTPVGPVEPPVHAPWAGVTVPTPGWHSLYLARGPKPERLGTERPQAHRYPAWRVDRIVLVAHEGLRPAEDGPPETRNDGTLAPAPAALARRDWRPRHTWSVRDGYAVIEAEAIDHAPAWVERTEPKGFTGRSFLEWQGPDRTVSVEGLGGNNDTFHVRQGPPEEWLILRLQVEEPGTYLLDVRNIHAHKDGDNDAWVAPIGARGTAEKPIGRLGDSHGDGTGFTWLDWGVHRMQLRAGLNEYYIGGRSRGFGIDRIAIYRDGDVAARNRALDPGTPAQVASPE